MTEDRKPLFLADENDAVRLCTCDSVPDDSSAKDGRENTDVDELSPFEDEPK